MSAFNEMEAQMITRELGRIIQQDAKLYLAGNLRKFASEEPNVAGTALVYDGADIPAADGKDTAVLPTKGANTAKLWPIVTASTCRILRQKRKTQCPGARQGSVR
ncbi:MAG: hypothetical protein IKO64_06235 [Kiritimatiellae bacterium]|nr:hypothetical protein [Kiritimatiellia bacterium]